MYGTEILEAEVSRLQLQDVERAVVEARPMLVLEHSIYSIAGMRTLLGALVRLGRRSAAQHRGAQRRTMSRQAVVSGTAQPA